MSDRGGITTRRAIAVAVALFALLYAVKVSQKEGDLSVFIRAAENLLQGSGIYRNEPDAFPYPPFCALLYVPFTIPGLRTARIALYLLDLAAIAVIVRAVRTLVFASEPWKPDPVRSWLSPTIVVALGTLLTLRFFLSTIDNQQSDLLLVAATLSGLVALKQRRELLCGALLALGVAVKLTPLLFLPYLLLTRRPRAAFFMVLFTTGFFLLPEILFPASTGIPLIESFYDVVMTKTVPWEGGVPWTDGGGIWTSTNILNQSLAPTLYRYLSGEPVRLLSTGETVSVGIFHLPVYISRAVVYAAEALLVVVSGFAVTRGGDSGNREDLEFGIVLCMMLLLSPQSSKPHFSSLILPHVLLVHRFEGDGSRFTLAVLIASFLSMTFSAEGFVGKRFSDVMEAHGTVTFGTVLIWGRLLTLRWSEVPWEIGRRIPGTGSRPVSS